MIKNSIEFLELINDNDIIKYHEGLYEAFVNRNYDKWLIKNYIISGNRLIPPFKKIIIYGVKDNNKLISAVGVNLDNKMQMQFEKLGFKKCNFDINRIICEILNMYILKKIIGENFMKIFLSFLEYILKDLKQKNYDVMYLTCSKKLENMFLITGFDLIDEKKIDLEDEILFKIDL